MSGLPYQGKYVQWMQLCLILVCLSMYMDAVCVDSFVAPFGRHIVKGLSDLFLLFKGALIKRKWPVHPDYTIYVSCCLQNCGVQQPSNSLLLFKVAPPSHHSLLA
jgi:hypothetical protein